MPNRRRGVALRWLPGALVLAVLAVMAIRAVEWQHFSDLLRGAQPAWLLAAAALQIGTYVCAAGVLHRGIRASDVHRSILSLVPLGLAKLFIDQVVPTVGIGGTVLVVRAMERRGVPLGVATAAVVVNTLAFYLAYAIAVAFSLGVLWFHRHLHPAVLFLVTVFAIYATAIPVLILWLVFGSPRKVPAWIRRIPGLDAALRGIADAPSSTLRHPLLYLEACALQLAILVLDAATLYVLVLSLGHHADPAVLFTSFVLASMAATLSLLPGGVGSFEAGSVASLRSMGLPLELSIASTLLLRGFTLWLPMVPGIWFARREMTGGAGS